MGSFVFINQHEIEFTNNELQKTVTIFNPFDFVISFRFKSTRPDAFQLSTTQGNILSRHSLDIVINLIDETIIEERFLIMIYSKDKKLDEKTLPVSYRKHDERRERSQHQQQQQHLSPALSTNNDDYFHDIQDQNLHFGHHHHHHRSNNAAMRAADKQNQYLIWFALIICLILLMLPHDNDDHDQQQHSMISDYLQISVNVKICAAYVLGIVTVLMIRN